MHGVAGQGSLYHKERKSVPVGFSSSMNKCNSKTVLWKEKNKTKQCCGGQDRLKVWVSN